MFYDLGLTACAAVGSWFAFDLLVARKWRQFSVAMGSLGVAAAAWGAGEIVVRGAEAPNELALGRLLVYFGASFLCVCLLWVSVQAACPAWWRKRPWVLIAIAGIAAFFYSTFGLGDGDWLASLSSPSPRHGPLFPVFAAYNWSLGAVAIYYLVEVARRLRDVRPLRMAAMTYGLAVPIVANILYVSGVIGPLDPTPVLLAAAGLLFRLVILDAGLAMHIPLGRTEVIEQLQVGIVVANLHGTVVDMNQAASRLLGDNFLRGQSLADVLASKAITASAQLETRTFPLRSAFSEVGTVAVLTDRSDLVDSERRLRLAARLESVGSLTAGIAHEINNPLAFVGANIAEARKTSHELERADMGACLAGDLGERVADQVDILTQAEEGVERIVELVSRLRTFARSGSSDERETVSLAQVASDAIAMARVSIKQGAIVEEFGAVPRLSGRRGDLVQIVLNLLVNAIQASPDRVDIVVRIRPHAEGASLEVLDRGRGIPPKLLDQIFDPFFTTKQPGRGTGLGLSISYDLAADQGGFLEAANRPGGGAVFTLYLPHCRALVDESGVGS